MGRPGAAPRWRAAWAGIATPLDRYIGAAVLRTFILAASGLTGLFSLLTFVDQLAQVGQGRYSVSDALAYVLLTAPSRLVQAAPVAMLIGCLLALGALGRGSELTAMRSLGVSESRIIGAVLKLAVPIILALFLIAEFVVPPAQEHADTARTTALSRAATDHGPDSFQGQGGFWAQGGAAAGSAGARQFLNVQRFRGKDEAEGIDIYSFAADGRLARLLRADRAEIRPDGIWLLRDVRQQTITASGVRAEHLASFPWHPFLSPAQIRLLRLPPEAMPPVELFRYVRDLRRDHLQGLRYAQELWRQIGIPLSLVAMILASAPFVFAPARHQGVGQQVAIGAIIGIVFSLVQQLAGHLTLLLDLDPAATALAPPLLLTMLSVHLFLRANR